MNNTSLAFNIRKNEWKTNSNIIFPEILYIDANPVINILLKKDRGSTEAYWRELNKNGGMITWGNDTIEEVTGVLNANQLAYFASNNNITAVNLPNGRKDAWKVAEDTISDSDASTIANEVMQQVRRVEVILNQYGLPSDDIDYKVVHDLGQALYAKYGGGPKDAKHIAAANQIGTNNIMSNDPGLLRYPNQNIFGTSNTLLKYVNANQLPGSYVNLSSIINNDEENEQVSKNKQSVD